MFVAYIVRATCQHENTPPRKRRSRLRPCQGVGAAGHRRSARAVVYSADRCGQRHLIAQALACRSRSLRRPCGTGTSLPELVTAITSLAKGHGALSLGNVIGANVFNLVLVSGVSVTLAPFSIPQNSTIAGMNASLVMDIPVMFAVMLLLTVPALIKGKLSRPQGIALLCIYAAFCAVQFSI